MKLRLRKAAEQDIAAAIHWYDEQRPGLGETFLAAVSESLKRIQANPYLYSTVHSDVRRALLPRPFPYIVLFSVKTDIVVVYAVLHQARHPDRWQRR